MARAARWVYVEPCYVEDEHSCYGVRLGAFWGRKGSPKKMGVTETITAIARARGYVEAVSADRAHRLFAHDGCAVLVIVEDKLTLSLAKACVSHADRACASRLVVVLGASPSSAARAALIDLAGRPVEFFTFLELSFDIMTHELVPKFEVLGADEIPALLHRYRVKLAQLPRLHYTDPCARYLGLARGQVVRVRRAGSGGESVGYRIVT